eukprot:7503254-Pyramimonas_sp.AAC.1
MTLRGPEPWGSRTRRCRTASARSSSAGSDATGWCAWRSGSVTPPTTSVARVSPRPAPPRHATCGRVHLREGKKVCRVREDSVSPDSQRELCHPCVQTQDAIAQWNARNVNWCAHHSVNWALAATNSPSVGVTSPLDVVGLALTVWSAAGSCSRRHLVPDHGLRGHRLRPLRREHVLLRPRPDHRRRRQVLLQGLCRQEPHPRHPREHRRGGLLRRHTLLVRARAHAPSTYIRLLVRWDALPIVYDVRYLVIYDIRCRIYMIYDT